MTQTPEWSIVFYIETDGSSPITEFLSGLDKKTQARFAWSIEQLRVRNVQAREPLVRHIEGDIWELREESSTNIYRIMYVLFHRTENRPAPWLSEKDAEDATA